MQIGIDGTNKNIIDGYIGVNGVNKRLKQVLIGIDGVNKEVWANVQRVPRGTIVVWSGTAEEIPKGWYLCDGNNGTPNLLNRFIMGGTTAGATGGGAHTHIVAEGGAHSHTVNSVTHTHGRTSEGGVVARTTYGDVIADGGHEHTISTGGSHNHKMSSVVAEPPYYSLAYIMKG